MDAEGDHIPDLKIENFGPNKGEDTQFWFLNPC